MDIGLLLWQELFTDSTLFSTETAWDNPHPAKASISNADILKFLTDAIEHSTLAKTAIKKWERRDLIKLKRVLEKLTSSDVLGGGIMQQSCWRRLRTGRKSLKT